MDRPRATPSQCGLLREHDCRTGSPDPRVSANDAAQRIRTAVEAAESELRRSDAPETVEPYPLFLFDRPSQTPRYAETEFAGRREGETEVRFRSLRASPRQPSPGESLLMVRRRAQRGRPSRKRLAGRQGFELRYRVQRNGSGTPARFGPRRFRGCCRPAVPSSGRSTGAANCAVFVTAHDGSGDTGQKRDRGIL